MGRFKNFTWTGFILVFATILLQEASAEDRCKDDSFCKAYCLSTNPDTVSARCGRDLASCICITSYNQAVKVRFIEERPPVPLTTPTTTTTTPRPTTPTHQPPAAAGIHYVNSQPVANNAQFYYNGNGNSIAGNNYPQQQYHQQQPSQNQQQQDRLTPVLLECDASEASTRMCHSFCTLEIRSYYGLCNVTSKACACFGVPPSAVQEEPIAAIFHSTAPVPPPPPPASSPRPFPQQPLQTAYQQPQQQLPPSQQQQFQQSFPQDQYQYQQWKPIPSSASYQHPQQQGHLNSYQYQYPSQFPPSPSVLTPATQNNQLQDQGPVRSVASMFGANGQPVSPSILTPASPFPSSSQGLSAPVPASAAHFPDPIDNGETTDPATEEVPTTTDAVSEDKPNSSTPSARGKRSLNEMPIRKEVPKLISKDLIMKGDTCTKYKCGIACKRSNYFAPDCKPQCVDGECLCECTPRPNA